MNPSSPSLNSDTATALTCPHWQANNYVVFDKYFDTAVSNTHNARQPSGALSRYDLPQLISLN